MTRILIVTAVEAERAAVLRGLADAVNQISGTAAGSNDVHLPHMAAVAAARPSPSETAGTGPDRTDPDTGEDGGSDARVTVIAGGVGPAAAAASTAVALATARAHGRAYAIVVSMGIGGAFSGRAAMGDVVVGSESIAADLGAQSPDGFLTVAELGFGTVLIGADPDLVDVFAKAGATVGAVVTVSTVTGTAERAAQLAAAHPGACVEAMEGYGVACAAEATGTRFVEVRTISNMIGPRDRAAWRIGDALTALSAAAATVGTLAG